MVADRSNLTTAPMWPWSSTPCDVVTVPTMTKPCHHVCWPQLSTSKGTGVKLTGKLVAGSVCWFAPTVAMDHFLYNLWKKLTLEMGRYEARSLRYMLHDFSAQWLDNGVLIAAWKHELLEQWVTTHCSNDWSQDMTGTLDKPNGYRTIGSSLHCLAGDFCSIFITSSVPSAVTGARSDSGWSTTWSLCRTVTVRKFIWTDLNKYTAS